MTSDDADGIARYNLDDGTGDDLPARSYWWSLHRPETYALAALAIAFASFLSVGPSEEIAQAIILGFQQGGGKALLYTVSGIRLGISLIAMFGAVLSIRSEDEDTTWSAPVARAALLIAIFTALLAAGAIIATALVSQHSDTGF